MPLQKEIHDEICLALEVIFCLLYRERVAMAAVFRPVDWLQGFLLARAGWGREGWSVERVNKGGSAYEKMK